MLSKVLNTISASVPCHTSVLSPISLSPCQPIGALYTTFYGNAIGLHFSLLPATTVSEGWIRRGRLALEAISKPGSGGHPHDFASLRSCSTDYGRFVPGCSKLGRGF